MKPDFAFARKSKLGLFYVLFWEGTEQENRMKRLTFILLSFLFNSRLL